MKRCPFCAEEIQEAAVKCRFCGEFLAGAAHTPGAAAGAPPAKLAPAVPERRMLYEGCPSWKAYLGSYVLVGAGALLAIVALEWFRGSGAALGTRALHVAAPLVAAALCGLVVTLVRRSTKFRVTTTAIEFERGLISKRIDVLQLWRIRDVVYRQNLIDRVLGIAHVEVIGSDATTPDLQIVGMPASRQLFEQLRDSIEIQRQAKNVFGVVS